MGNPAVARTKVAKSSTKQKTQPQLKRVGVTIPRYFTKPGENPLDQVTWTQRDSVISEPDGSVVFELKDAEVPETWSQLATDIVAAKYFRKAGVPGSGSETSVRQLITRVSHTLRGAGEDLRKAASAIVRIQR